MTLPNRNDKLIVLPLDDRGLFSVRVMVIDSCISLGVANGCASAGVDLCPWDAAALGAVLLGVADVSSPLRLATA